jgi:simple sugar transport system ATP-binding protein
MFGQIPPQSKRQKFEIGQPVLELENVTAGDYRLQIQDINLSVGAGEVFGLAGLEGSGQRRLIHTCAGLVIPQKGTIKLVGNDITHRSYHDRRASGVAYLAAGRLEEGLVGGLTLTEHLVLAMPEHTFLIDWDGAKVEMINRIEHYEIIGRPESTAAELSGGNQQRLLFALLDTPLKLLMLEHPTRGLDVRSTNYTWELLYKRRADGTAILFMSADLDEIIERSDRIAVFSGGRMSRVVAASETSVDELGHLIGGRK